jgi:basic membrane protein A
VDRASGSRQAEPTVAGRRALAGVLLACALVLAACGPSGSPGTTSTQVCVVTNADGLAAHTFNQLAVDGAKSTSVPVQVMQSHAVSDYLGNLERCAAIKPALVIAPSPDMAPAVWRAAQLHASQRYALVDAVPVDANGQPADLGNVSELFFKAQEPAYLVGALAGLLEKEKVGSATHNVVGILGSNHGPAVDPYIAGYVAGARAVDPGVSINVTYSDSQDTAFCKQLGINQISAGADILFEVTGRCASGYIDAAYDASAYAVGSDNDEAYLSPAVITSALKRVDRAVAITVQRLQNGQFKAGRQLFGVQDDAIGFSTPSSVVPQDVINQVLDLRTKIRTGVIVPPDTPPPGI